MTTLAILSYMQSEHARLTAAHKTLALKHKTLWEARPRDITVWVAHCRRLQQHHADINNHQFALRLTCRERSFTAPARDVWTKEQIKALLAKGRRLIEQSRVTRQQAKLAVAGLRRSSQQTSEPLATPGKLLVEHRRWQFPANGQKR